MIDDGGIPLAPAPLLAEAARVLTTASYRVERDAEKLLDLPSERAFIAEDKYGVVVVVVYDSCSTATPTPNARARWASSSARIWIRHRH